MDAEQTQLFRDTILRAARNYPRGLTLATIDVCLRNGGHDHFTRRDVEFHVDYLVGKGLMQKTDKSHTAANALFKLTAAGVDDLETRNL